MKKILILVMSCKDKFFVEQEAYIDNTWGKDILDGKYPNITLLKYHGGESENKIEDNVFKLNCEDDINNTFKKTFVALSLCHNYYEYDYIFRVNTSTYVNVPLLNAFVQSLEKDDILWCAETYSLSEVMAPFPLYLYGRGNALLLSKFLVNVILGHGFSYLYYNMIDDHVIGNILNSFWIKKGEDYLQHIKSFRHGWFRCINQELSMKNSICYWNNSNTDFDYIKTFITIQIKRYWEREIENKNYTDLHKAFENNVDDDIENTVKMQYEYSLNPSVFIGSILGYIDYDKWVNFDKRQLYYIETHNKSADDPMRGKAQDLIIL